jgi:hypothetical protein
MRMKSLLRIIGLVAILVVPVAIVYALPLVPCDGVDCQSCDFVEMINRIVKWFIGIMSILCGLVVVYAGIQMVTSGGNESAWSHAKSMLTNVLIGFVILLTAWLIVDTIMKTFVDENSGMGPWNEIQCISMTTPSSQPSTTGPGSSSGPGSSATIADATQKMMGFSTAAGPGDGNLACAWAVNKVLSDAGVPPLDGDSVRQMETALQGGRGTRINQSSAQPGDIVIVTDGARAHTGICLNTGCSQVISNSSSNKSFSWKSGPDFAPSYGAGVGRIYRVGGG